MWLDDMLSVYQSSECVRTGKAARHQCVVIDAARLLASFARINKQLSILVLGRFDIDSESRRRRDYAIVKRMRRLMVSIQVRIDIEQLTERYLSAHTLQIHSRSVSRADLQIGDIERAIITIAITSDEVGQLPLRCG